MANSDYIHLDVHTEYAIEDSVVRIPALIAKVKELGMPAVAITDINNTFGAVKFYMAALKQGIKPIVGATVRIASAAEAGYSELILFAMNKNGFHNLAEIVSVVYLEDGVGFVPRDYLTPARTEDLLALCGGRDGVLGHLLDDKDSAVAELEHYLKLFPGRFYCQIRWLGAADDFAVCQRTVAVANELKVPVIATSKVVFLDPADHLSHEVRVAINKGRLLADPERPQAAWPGQYLKSQDEMATDFSFIPMALTNTVALAQRCNLHWQFGEVFLPDYPVGVGYKNLSDYLRGLSVERLGQRGINIAKQPEYGKRLEFEAGVVDKMGFAGYFLIVADFIMWSKENDIPVGPGRGSGAGSLIAYALGITDLDPLEHNLLFERFLNPERVSMPDFDIDFCMEGRDRVIEYVVKRYGADCVSQISTFGTMAAKAVVRDVGRVMGFPYGFVDPIARLIPFDLGTTLTSALEQEPDLLERYNKDEEVKQVIDMGLKLEGLVRNVGRHAGGVVIAPSRLTNFTPLYAEQGGKNIMSQFDKDDIEKVGLVKFDFLGLRTLTIIDWAVKSINATLGADEQLDITTLPHDDAKTFKLLQACNTQAVFQLESHGMRDLIARLQPDSFEDIVALVALFRPGPLQSGMVDDFIDRKHGRKEVEFFHPDLEGILRPTYGVILYQEQVMQIAQVLAGYTLGSADMLRRAMGKKKPEEMAKQASIFVNGAVANGVDKKLAKELFDLIEKFAGYGFNRSHSAAYALLSYQTCWLKAHYPAEFMAAVMSTWLDMTDRLVVFGEDCQDNNIKVIPPNIQTGGVRFRANTKGEIIYSLAAVKGVGQGLVAEIVASRDSGGEFTSLFDFCRRVHGSNLNKRALEALIYSGALDCFEVAREDLVATMPLAVGAAEALAAEQASGQVSLFGSSAGSGVTVSAPEYLRAAKIGRLAVLERERQVLGAFLSAHPLEVYAGDKQKLGLRSVATVLAKVGDKKAFAVTVVILRKRVKFNRQGNKFALLEVGDQSGRMELFMYNKEFLTYGHWLSEPGPMLVRAECIVDRFSGKQRLVVTSLQSWEEVRVDAKRLVIRLEQSAFSEVVAGKLASLVKGVARGQCVVELELKADGKIITIGCGEAWKVQLRQDFMAAIEVFEEIIDCEVYYRKEC